MNWKWIIFHLTLYLLFGGLSIHINAQQRCISNEMMEASLIKNPSLKSQRQIWVRQLAEGYEQIFQERAKIIIPVVVHVVFFNEEQNISDERIQSQIDRLNQDFSASNADLENVPNSFKILIANTGIQFCLAGKDPDGNPTTGIVRTPTSLDMIGTRIGSGGRRNVFYEDLQGSEIWDSEKYLNIYVCDVGDIGGYASSPYTAIPQEDGVVINSKYFGINNHPSFGLGRVCTHEVGHFFDLNHIWGSGTDCGDDDGIIDTPRQMGPYFGCPGHPQSSCGSEDLFMNYMDYVDDSCMVMFTGGQKLRMLSALSSPRLKLLNSTICINPDTAMMESGITIFPNPVNNGPLIVQSNDRNNLIQSWELYNVNGKLISSSYSKETFVAAIEIAHLPSSIYILHIKTILSSSVHKILKSN